ncbi:DOPA 4,5-dioxygenase family protein [Maritalea porphyrae]|uniref:DOPA 4,5-dioxygenase family protein n=1 Tax=Maritalea porphyrae TaxID=880732 RepID=UPI0022AF381C|nr:DOPA 4,5-dioxygenase family protein [Maritalea porphyrae]MCZ4271061.1 DOPA 4,5-dioxygenase family protein [Maritalea porphyrae]
MHNTDIIQDYHAHIYFGSVTAGLAKELCENAVEQFGVKMGRMHEKPVGPHPMWSCQLTATTDQFAELLPWLALNRNSLIIFAHPQTGNDLIDHRDRGIWLGAGLELDFSVFD